MQSGKFLQSNEWADFQKTLGRKVFFVNNILIIKMPLKFGFSYLYSPKNSAIDLEKIKKIVQKEKVIFYRIEPKKKLDKKFIASKDIQPRCTQILNLKKSEDELLRGMKQKTRYNIRLAERKKVIIKKGSVDNLYNLLEQTYDRQNIRSYSKEYYRKLAKFNDVFIAYYKNKPAAGAMVNFFEDTATYLHGGSSQEYKNIMAPYLLHWEIIKYAKSNKIKYYDWWGIDDKKWPGITRFKKGFGGEELCAPGTFDLPFNKFLYFIYKIMRR